AAVEPPLVAVNPAEVLPAVAALADATGADGSDPLLDSLPGGGPTAQPVSDRGGSSRPASAGGRSACRTVLAVGGTANGNPLASRTGAARAAGVRGHGGNAASEAAVERGLEWLSLHQAVDGSWQFDLSGCRCQGACRDPGTLTSSTASTAIALLPFLGAGHTHLDGRHQETVSRGIYYLLSRMERTPRGADFCEGTMYGHGVTTLVLAEALGMTKDDMLAPAVRDAVRFIETAQDMHSGGWRYLPGQSGDITITAWQLTALKSAQLAGLEAPSPTIDGIRRFLDRVQSQHGAAYGYRTPAAKPCTSAIGLLCRMYTGWGPAEEPLVRGVTTLAKQGPAPEAVYQNFYLSQALLQLNHPAWPRWNQKNRDQLVVRQSRQGHEAGSWFFADHDTAPGGRLAHTSLAILTLEVYYRLLPIYQQEAVESEF
ncbi:MAG: prenyltransferase/squalene oxidase repeat-containing protein, partial [Planctomycetia bacterium]